MNLAPPKMELALYCTPQIFPSPPSAALPWASQQPRPSDAVPRGMPSWQSTPGWT